MQNFNKTNTIEQDPAVLSVGGSRYASAPPLSYNTNSAFYNGYPIQQVFSQLNPPLLSCQPGMNPTNVYYSPMSPPPALDFQLFTPQRAAVHYNRQTYNDSTKSNTDLKLLPDLRCSTESTAKENYGKKKHGSGTQEFGSSLPKQQPPRTFKGFPGHSSMNDLTQNLSKSKQLPNSDINVEESIEIFKSKSPVNKISAVRERDLIWTSIPDSINLMKSQPSLMNNRFDMLAKWCQQLTYWNHKYKAKIKHGKSVQDEGGLLCTMIKSKLSSHNGLYYSMVNGKIIEAILRWETELPFVKGSWQITIKICISGRVMTHLAYLDGLPLCKLKRLHKRYCLDYVLVKFPMNCLTGDDQSFERHQYCRAVNEQIARQRKGFRIRPRADIDTFSLANYSRFYKEQHYGTSSKEHNPWVNDLPNSDYLSPMSYHVIKTYQNPTAPSPRDAYYSDEDSSEEERLSNDSMKLYQHTKRRDKLEQEHKQRELEESRRILTEWVAIKSKFWKEDYAERLAYTGHSLAEYANAVQQNRIFSNMGDRSNDKNLLVMALDTGLNVAQLMHTIIYPSCHQVFRDYDQFQI